MAVLDRLAPSEMRECLARDGFVRIQAALSAEQVESLRAACKHSADLARAEKWPFVRTLPKQFPPWDGDRSHGIWGVQHLMHPDLPDHETFAASYFAPHVLAAVTALLECNVEDLVMELYNLLIRPDSDFALRWHRDDIPPHVSAAEEEARLGERICHAQWNLALYDDSSLVVVPGSQKRARTNTERTADPFEDNMPGQISVNMQAGDIVFYNNNILHRGVYSCENERMTLHGSMGIVSDDRARARNVLQHGIGGWVDKCDFSNLHGDFEGVTLSHLAERMRARLVTMGTGKDEGYSQSDD
ncbi:hypothetical protein MBLNU459_g5469t1 [Dothideomycetes sp. NU459]